VKLALILALCGFLTACASRPYLIPSAETWEPGTVKVWSYRF